ncbi:type I pantothenate kinase [Hyphomonas jannaschiana]|uniref:type I pantothenate kinase n=1 Tax=Hyphomonas jannaschiana TaxID=86 RepID=UPI0035C7408C
MTTTPKTPADEGIRALATRLAELQSDRAGLIAGLTGSVASGKTTLAGALADVLDDTLEVETVSTDGFLFPNSVLAERDLTLRKGFPETYDHQALGTALSALRTGEAPFPAYSHVSYDVDPALTRIIAQPDVLILEGLGFQPLSPPPREAHEPDLLIYLDASEDDLLFWFLERFVRLWNAAREDHSSFYANFLHMSEPELMEFAQSVWERINLPNLRENIAPLKQRADIVLFKTRDHTVTIAEDRLL